MKYGIWNNKGGVGKTFLSFILGTEYAVRNPDRHVLLVDMCPQANLTEIVLGGNGIGAEALQTLLEQGENRISVGGYFDLRIESPHRMVGRETDFMIHAATHNPNLPDNLHIIAGDPSLELQAQVISQIGSQTLPPNAWKNVRGWLKDLIGACTSKLGETTVFIDCNPSFSAYTELAIAASDRLILPCSSDGSSARAITNVAALLYGHGLNEAHKSVNFSSRAANSGIGLPLIQAIILNRSTQYNQKASKAFAAMFMAIRRRAEGFKAARPSCFVSGALNFLDMPDSHSVAIVCSHHGMPLSKIKAGPYDVHDTRPQVNPGPLERYKEALDRLIETL